MIRIKGLPPPVEGKFDMTLELVPKSDGNVVLRGTDRRGRLWEILAITQEGRLLRFADIHSTSGWPLTRFGCLASTVEEAYHNK